MVIYLFHILIAYRAMLSKIMQYHKKYLLLIGVPAVIGLVLLFSIVSEYEAILSERTIYFLQQFFPADLTNQNASDYSYIFVLELFSVRTCFLVQVFFVLILCTWVFIFPSFYFFSLLIVRLMFKEHLYFKWSNFWSMYGYTLEFFFARGFISSLYLFILFVFSFIPFLNLVVVFTSFFIVSNFWGSYLLGFARRFGNFPDLQYLKKEFDLSAMIFGGFALATFLVPFIGWLFLPIIHIPTMIYFLKSFGSIEE